MNQQTVGRGAWVLGMALGLSAVTAQAQQSNGLLPLMQANGCASCHSLTEKVIGPAFQNVAKKYSGEKDAGDMLAHSIQYGSKGKWGRIAMPPHPDLSAGDLKTITTWILAQQH